MGRRSRPVRAWDQHGSTGGGPMPPVNPGVAQAQTPPGRWIVGNLYGYRGVSTHGEGCSIDRRVCGGHDAGPGSVQWDRPACAVIGPGNRHRRPGVQGNRRTTAVQAAAKATGANDASLVQRLQTGDAGAFTELVRRYQDRVFNTAWRICGNAEDARDVTQEAFIKAYESIGSFRGASGFYTWVFRIAVNLAISHRRTTKRRATQSLDAPAEPHLAGSQAATLAARVQETQENNPAEGAMSAEVRGHVVTALQELDEEFRSVIVLRDIEGFDYRQIADILDIAPGTVKSRLHRGRLALRKLLEPVLGLEA